MNITRDGIIYSFEVYDLKEVKELKEYWRLNPSIHYNCCACDGNLDYKYSIIMSDLEKADLLPEDFKHYCCCCYFLMKVGLLDLYESFNSWNMLTDEDGKYSIVDIEFCFIEDDEYFNSYTVRIHDYEKFLLS